MHNLDLAHNGLVHRLWKEENPLYICLDVTHICVREHGWFIEERVFTT
jgi:hypothetical protein